VIPITVQSVGWGRQSWTLLAMQALNEHPRADYHVFADTGHEGQGTYEFARRMTPWLGEHGITVVTVQADNVNVVREDWNNGGVLIPAYTTDAETGKQGVVRRACTGDWKMAPIRRFVRSELAKRGQRPRPGCVESWQGISWDESTRIRDSDVKYITNRYPLVDLRMTVRDCIQWCIDHDLPVAPKSACTFCPFVSAQRWADTKRRQGHDWKEAVAVDESLRTVHLDLKGLLYVHPARVPLPQAVRIPEDGGAYQMEMGIECEGGYCHV
jgi:hypothetical protein